jgi:hypothetical protein
MGQCTHPDCSDQALPGSNRCSAHPVGGSRSEKIEELSGLDGAAGGGGYGSGLGGLGTRGRAPTGGFGSVYGYLTQEYKVAPNKSGAAAAIAVIVVVAAIAYFVMRMRETPIGP